MGSTFRLWTSKWKLTIQEAEDTDFVRYLREANIRVLYLVSFTYVGFYSSLPKLFFLIWNRYSFGAFILAVDLRPSTELVVC
jgi:hypothetical protein